MKSTIRAILPIGLLFCLLLFLWGCNPRAISGTVVGEATGKPVAGALTKTSSLKEALKEQPRGSVPGGLLTRVGYVNAGEVFLKYKGTATAVEQFSAEKEKKEQELQQLQEQFQSGQISSDDYQSRVQEIQQELQQLDLQLTAKVQQEIIAATKEIATENDFTWVTRKEDVVLFAAPGVMSDLTSPVIERLNSKLEGREFPAARDIPTAEVNVPTRRIQKIGYVDAEQIFLKYKGTATVVQQFSEEKQKKEEELVKLQEQFRSGQISQAEFQRRYQEIQQELQQLDLQLTSKVQQEMIAVVTEIAQERGFDWVTRKKDVVLYAQPGVFADLTEGVLARLNLGQQALTPVEIQMPSKEIKRVACVNAEEVLLKYKGTATAVEQFSAEKQKKEQELQQLQAQLQAGQASQEEFQRRYQEIQQELQQLDLQLTAKVQQEMIGAVTEIAQERGYDWLMRKKDVLLYVKPGLVDDITELVLQKMNEKTSHIAAADTTPPEVIITSGPRGEINYNNITFQWTGSDDQTETTELVYSYYLEGYDDAWSNWTSETSKRYSDLPEGSYTFRVKAKDQAGNITPVASEISFSITTQVSQPEPEFPLQLNYVSDYAEVIDGATEKYLNDLLKELEKKTAAEVAVLTVKSTKPLDIFDYGMAAFDRWEIGSQGKDNGLLFLVAVEDREMYIFTGYGLEGVLPDGKVAEIRDRDVLPEFRQDDYAGGIRNGVEAIVKVIDLRLAGASNVEEEPVATAPVDEHAVIGEYINPLNPDDSLEINADGTCYMEVLGLNMGTTGRWKVENGQISVLFPDGTTFRGTVKSEAILLEEFGMLSVVWIKPTKSPPEILDVAGRYVKEGYPDEYLVLNVGGTYTRTERGIGGELFTYSGEWELDGHAVTLFFQGDRSLRITAAILENRLYFTGLFGTDIWIGEPREEPAPEEVSPVEPSPEEETVSGEGEPPEVEWERFFSTSGEDRGIAAQQTDDGGYIVLGNTTSELNGYDIPVIWLIKTDAFGTEEWERTFGGEPERWAHDGGYGYLYAYSIEQTSDGGYIIIGKATSGSSQLDIVWLIKTDAFGAKEWERTFGKEPERSGYGYSVEQTSDGGYIIVGEHGDIWLIKTDSFGKRQWEKAFGGPSRDWGLSVEQTDDGGYIIGGLNFSHSGGWDDDIWLIRTDSQGRKLWDRLYGGQSTEELFRVLETSDGGFLVVGTTDSDDDEVWDLDLWMFKTDSYGEELWSTTFDEVSEDGTGWVSETTDDGYVICSSYESYKSGELQRSLWLLQTTASGELSWSKKFGGDSICAYVQQTNDGGYMVLGTDLSGEGGGDIWLIKLRGTGVAPQKEEVSCKIELRNQGSSTLIDITGVNESFNIHVEAPSGNPNQVRFSSDEDQDGLATGEWTDWYDWTTPSGSWDAETKTMAWTFTTSGEKEVWVEIKDDAGSVKCFANIDANNTDDNATISELEGLIDDLVEDYRNNLNEIKGYTLSNAESFGYFDNSVSKDEIDIIVDFGATLFSLALTGLPSTAEVIHYKHTSVLSVIDQITWEARHPDAYALLESIGGIDNIAKAWTELTKKELMFLAREALKEISYRLTSKESSSFRKKLLLHLGQQINKDAQQLESLAEEAKQALWSLTPEEAKQYVVELQGLRKGNAYLVSNYSQKSSLTRAIAEIRKIDENDWKLRLADFLWSSSIGLLGVSAHLATGGFLLPATITAIDGAREQFFENRQKLSVDAQMAGLAAEALNEGFTVGSTIYKNTQQALRDIRDRNHVCIPQGSISVENKRIRKVFESGTAVTTPLYLGKEEVSDVHVAKDEECGEETEYSLAVSYKTSYTSFKLFPGLDVTYKNLLPVQKTAEVEDNSVTFQYDVSPDGTVLQFYLFGKTEDRLYGLAHSGIKWDPVEVREKVSRDYLGGFVNSAIEEENYERLSVYYDQDADKVTYKPTEVARIKSPGELRMYDSEERVTGLVDGRIKEEIPGTVYDDKEKLIVVLDATDSYHYEVAGTEEGRYGLEITSIAGGETLTFSAANMPTTPGTVHQYTIDWDALAKGGQGVSLEVDSEGNGTFERVFRLQDEFDGNRVSLEELANPKKDTNLGLWVLLGVIFATIVVVAAAI